MIKNHSAYLIAVVSIWSTTCKDSSREGIETARLIISTFLFFTSYFYTTDDKPTMPQLLSFQGKTECFDVAQEIGIQWRVIGTILLDDKNGTIMPAIAQQFANNVQDINMEVLSRWIQRKGIECTWRVLLDALRGPCRALAKNVREALTLDPQEAAADSEPGKL